MTADSLVAPIDGVSSSVLDEFRTGFRAHAVMAMKRQEELNAASTRLENASRLMEGIGQLKYRIDTDLYFHMRAIYGPDCWRDPDFTAALERDGVIVRVKGVSDKVMSFAPAEQGEVERRGSRVESQKKIILDHTFPESELPTPSISGVVDGTEITESTDQVVS
jgi:hypothetical protein